MDDFTRPPQRGERHTPQSHSASTGFLTPEEVAAQDENLPASSLPDAPTSGAHHKQPHWWHRLTKKQWIIIGVVVALLLIGGGCAWWHHAHAKKSVTQAAAVKPQPKPASKVAPLTSTLTGLPISDVSVNQKPVTAIMIENSTDARPQSGLDKAGVVFEAVAEGGITRFLTLWQDTSADYIGPVRSVRPYYIQWLMGFDAAVAHAGGSPEALNDLKAWNVKDLDQFANGAYYQRISTRYAPHNLYTSLGQLQTLEAKKGIGAPKYTGFARKPEQPSKNPTVKSIDFNISGYYYNVHYDYDAVTNTYKRSEGGKPHMTVDKSGAQTQIAPKVVVALTMPQGIESDDLHTSYSTIGSGHMFVFQDGTLTEGTWSKTSSTAQFTFTDEKGATLKLDPGQTWITVVGSNDDVKHS